MHKMKLFLKLFFTGTVLLAGCHSDLYTKKLATESLKDQRSVPLVSGFIDLRYTENEGVSFSLLENLDDGIRTPVIITLQMISTLVLLGVIIRFRHKSAMTLLPFVLVLAGAFGNLFDRIRYGHVVDFIHFHVQDGFSWPVFNLADVWVTIGIAILLLQIMTGRDPFSRPEPAETV